MLFQFGSDNHSWSTYILVLFDTIHRYVVDCGFCHTLNHWKSPTDFIESNKFHIILRSCTNPTLLISPTAVNQQHTGGTHKSINQQDQIPQLQQPTNTSCQAQENSNKTGSRLIQKIRNSHVNFRLDNPLLRLDTLHQVNANLNQPDPAIYPSHRLLEHWES